MMSVGLLMTRPLRTVGRTTALVVALLAFCASSGRTVHSEANKVWWAAK